MLEKSVRALKFLVGASAGFRGRSSSLLTGQKGGSWKFLNIIFGSVNYI